MAVSVTVRRGEYHDSVRLMQVSEALRLEGGVDEAMLIMATENNKRLLQMAGLWASEMESATANDLVVAIRAKSDETIEQAMRTAQALLTERTRGPHLTTCRTLQSAMDSLPGANWAIISVPGVYAAAEARRALERNLNVLVFSDNVTVEDEVALKQLACERGLLLMGPDCGTAVINGVALGFANVVRRGGVGIVGASGTGIQEICVILDRQGAGISHAIGTGGRDLSDAVGGSMMLRAIDLLEADAGTRAIVLVSKPCSAGVEERIIARAAACAKPVIVNLLGGNPALASAAGLAVSSTLEGAAQAACLALGMGDGTGQEHGQPEGYWQQLAAQEAAQLAPGQRYIRGLFSGGTLGYEAMLILREIVGDVFSNVPLHPELRLPNPWTSQRHSVIDLGDDEFTRGRAHPMIDPTLRIHRILAEAQEPDVAVLLLDLVLGYGSHPDPAGSLAGAIQEARQKARGEGRHLAVVAHVCGTSEDPQNLGTQETVLKQAGALVAPTNAQASRLAGWIAGAGMEHVRQVP